MNMIRYSAITGKNQREIVLLKAHPCKWGRCSFCDYIADNSTNEEKMIQLNKTILKAVTGKYRVLEVINSGSCFEIPQETLEDIKRIVKEKKIETLFLESHWIYKDRLHEMEQFFGIPIVFKCGIETFDHKFRNEVLKKGIHFTDPQEVSKYFKSICLMVGIEGQTKEMVDQDMEYLQKYFERGCINIYMDNSTPIKRQDSLVQWFKEKYRYLEQKENIEILFENTDFGVGGVVNV